MKSTSIRGACVRVKAALDDAMAQGALNLSPELLAHAARCPCCGPEYRETEALLARLRAAAAGVDLRQVPGVVDYVMARTLGESRPTAPVPAPLPNRRVQLVWVLGQVAAVAAVLVVVTSGLAYAVLKVNQAVGGTSPQAMVERLSAPLRDWTLIKVRDTK